MTKSIKFSKQNGEVLFKSYLYERLQSALNVLANGNYNLSIKKEVKRRSLPQNALMWMWYEHLSRETGQNRNDIHDYFCAKFLSRQVEINGKVETFTKGTSKLNAEQFNDFLNKVHAECATEFGTTLPNPEDKNFQDFCDYYEKFL